MDEKKLRPLEELLDEVRDIDGFPIAKDEDILELSNPPYYTACPNPYIKDFIREHGKPYDLDNDNYDRKPYVGDVSEGKNGSIYNAHSYHTKVPYKAITKFIEHYTEPNDVIFDGFSGSGMTGIAAQMVNRNIILSDISPVASFITYCYNNPLNPQQAQKIQKILNKAKLDLGWMYQTNHINTDDGLATNLLEDYTEKGDINYIVWSDVFICPYCKNEYVFYDAAIDKDCVNKKFSCPTCNADLTKNECERALQTTFDTALNRKVESTKQVPVLINYTFNNKRYEKKPDRDDLDLINKIKEMEIPVWFPHNLMMEKGESWGDTWRAGYHYGMTNVNHFFTKRTLWILGYLWEKIDNPRLLFILTSSMLNLSKLYRFRTNRKGGVVSGTLYVPSTFQENNVFNSVERKLIDCIYDVEYNHNSIQSTQSITSLKNVPVNSVDYIFTDPPFGDNLMYSELNFIWESWLKVLTNNREEAIVNSSQNKGLDEYTGLMTKAFKEMFRILKPNRWITVVFHNSKASVWNAIQESISRAGFVIAQVSTLDKKQGSFKQVTSSGAVKNDLIINAYKPKKEFQDKFLKNAGEGMELEFIKQQLDHLPIGPNTERTEKMLFSKMLAHYVENGFKIRYNANNFYTLLHDNFVDRDGYWFLEDQAEEYTRWKSSLKLDELEDIRNGTQVLFVVDERSALTWVYHFLDDPKTFGEISNSYKQVLTKTDDQIPELQNMLEKNFVRENGKYRRPLSKQEKAEIEKNRERELDKAWRVLLDKAKSNKRKIKNVRKEALVHGFIKCYQEENYQDILTVADRLYTSTLESSGDIMDFVDIARIKLGG